MKVIAFDVFGTVYDLSAADRAEVWEYGRQIRLPEWQPLVLPESWERLPAHPDSAEGIARLRKVFKVVTCSNGPVPLLKKLAEHNGIFWDDYVDISVSRHYKPNLPAYEPIFTQCCCLPEDVMMVTANKDFGDLEAAAELGMTPMLIRGATGPKTIIELAQLFGL